MKKFSIVICLLTFFLIECNWHNKSESEKFIDDKLLSLISKSKKASENNKNDFVKLYTDSAINILISDTIPFSSFLKDSLALLYNLRGKALRELGDNIQAYEDFYRSIDITEGEKDPIFRKETFKSYYGLGVLFHYYQQGSNDALDYIEKASKYSTRKFDNAKIIYFKCETFITTQNYDSATFYWDSLISLSCYDIKKGKYDTLKLRVKNDELEEFNTMEPWFWEAKAKIAIICNSTFSQKILDDFNYCILLNINLKPIDKYQIAFVNYHIGEYLFNFNNYLDTAFNCFKIAYSIADTLNEKCIKMMAAKGLNDCYIRKNETDSANYYLNISNKLNIELNDKQLNVLKQEKLKAESDKIAKEKNRAKLILFLIIGIAVLIGGFVFLIVYFLRKKNELLLETENIKEKFEEANEDIKRRDEWNRIQNEFLIHREEILNDNKRLNDFTEIAKLIGRHFKSEYCGIGLIQDDKLLSLSSYTEFDPDKDQQKAIESIESIPINNTIIHDFLYKKLDYYSFTIGEIRAQKKEYIKILQEKILISKKVTNLILIGLYRIDKEKPNGYVSIINYKQFHTDDIKYIKNFGITLSALISSAYYQRSFINKKEDDNFIKKLQESKDNLDEILNKISEYFVKEFNIGVVSFRVPVINGEDINPEETLLFPLRNLYVDPKNPDKDKIIEQYFTKRKTWKLSDLKYAEELKKNFPKGIHFDDSSSKFNYEIKNISKLFETKCKIVLPIRKNDYQQNSESDTDMYWKNLYGIFNLRSYKIENKIETEIRLKYLSHCITHIINGKMHEKKSKQIVLLKQGIDKLDINKNPFYDQIAQLVAQIINADFCSIFMYDKRENKLKLKATTAKKAYLNDQIIEISELKYLDDIYYNIDDDKSVTVRTLLKGLTYQIYSLNYYQDYSRKFMEKTESGSDRDYSILFVPFKDKNGDYVGVLKCLGKIVDSSNLIHAFWDFDRETTEFIASLASIFIENYEADIEKEGFVKQIVHEMLSPLTEVLHKSEEFQSRTNRNYKLPPEFDKFNKGIVNNFLLLKQILIDLESITLGKTGEIKLNLHEDNVYQILLEVKDLFEEKALLEKGIKINISISNFPLLKIDKSKIKQVFINLMKNAVEYSYINTEITIYYKEVFEIIRNKERLKWHEIKFVNYGIGIPENEKDDILKLYRRGSNASKLKPSGSGIGLYLAKEIMRAHNGDCIIRKLDNPTEISVLFSAN